MEKLSEFALISSQENDNIFHIFDQGYRCKCKSDIAMFDLGVTWNYAYSPFNPDPPPFVLP